MNEGGKETCRLYFIEWIFGRDKREELKTVN